MREADYLEVILPFLDEWEHHAQDDVECVDHKCLFGVSKEGHHHGYHIDGQNEEEDLQGVLGHSGVLFLDVYLYDVQCCDTAYHDQHGQLESEPRFVP